MAAVACAVVVVVYAPLVLGGDTFAAPAHVLDVVPARAYLGAAIADGRVPQWWAEVGLGVPFAAVPEHGAAYPLAWLAAVAPDSRGADLVALLHVAIAALGCGALARRWGAGAIGAMVATAIATATGVAVAHASGAAPGLAAAWLPWVAWSAQGVAGAVGWARLRRSVPLVGALALAALADAVVVPIAGALALAVALPGARPGTRAPAILTVATAVLASLVVAAVALVPAWHADLLTGRADAPLGWRALWGAVVPGGHAAAYLSAPAVLLAVVARQHARLAIAAAALLLAALVGGMWIAAGAPIVCALAGVGVGRLAEASPRERRVALAAAALAAAGLVTATVVMVGRGPAALAAGLGALVATAGVAALARWGRGGRAAAVVVPAASALLVGHLASLVWTAPTVRRIEIDAVPRIAEDAAGPARIFRPARLPGDRDPLEPAAQLLRAHHSAEANTATRFGLGYLRGRHRARAPEIEQLFDAGAAAAARLVDLLGADYAIVPASLTVPSGELVHGRYEPAHVVLLGNRDARPRAFVAPAWRWHADTQGAIAALFAAGPGPPAGGAHEHPGHAGESAHRRPPGFDLSTLQLVGTGADAPQRATPVPIRACELDAAVPERVAMTCRSERGGYAVLLDRLAPGWTATVDGEPAPLVRAEAIARAVAVGPGEHRIVMRYRTPGLMLGAIISFLGLANLVLLWLIARMRMRSLAVKA